MMAQLPTQSWIGNAYQVGSIDRVAATPINFAPSFLAMLGGNQTGNGTAVKQQWFPPLEAGKHDEIYNALNDLISRLGNPVISGLAQSKVLQQLGNDSSGVPLTTKSFLSYLTSKHPLFFNGTTSSYCEDTLSDRNTCHTNWFLHFLLNGISVADAFARDPGTQALTGTPSNPLLTFFRPAEILDASQGRNLGNEAMIFHEALHGITGKYDYQVMAALGFKNALGPSCNISVMIENLVLSQSAGLDPATTTTDCQIVQ